MATAGAGRGVGPERAYAPELTEAGILTLDGPESSHLVRSRRLRDGDEVVLFDGKGLSVRGRLVEADPRAARIELLGIYPDREPARRVRLAVSPPEAGRADALVSQLAQLGADTLVLLRTARTPSGREALGARRAQRWGRLVIEAAKVNGRSRLLRVPPEAIPLSDFLARHGEEAILLDPDAGLVPLPDLLAAEAPLPWILVGPEGGFTPDELQEAEEAGARRARLGRPALRTETAALAAASILSVLA